MGKIEEVTDENEEEMLKDTKKSKGKNSKSDKKDKEGKNNEKGNDSQVSDEEDNAEEEDSSSDAEIDFTKSIPKEELLGDIASYQPAELVPDDCSECDDCDGNEGEDFFDDKKSESSSESLTSKRAIAFILLFPMLASGGYMLYELFGRFKLGKSSMQVTAAIGGAIIALIIMSNVKALQSAVKFVVCFAWLIFLFPSYQVYKCSPVPLKNDMLGTWFSLKTEASKFNELSFVSSECFQGYPFQSPYMLSVMNVKIALTVDINNMINLNVGKEQDSIDSEDLHMSNYFLLVSKRSVKKKFHKLHMIADAAPKLANILKESLKLSSADKDKKMLRITGGISDIGETLSPMKKELEGYGYLVRPIKFKVYEVKYIDRYAKLKNNENYY